MNRKLSKLLTIYFLLLIFTLLISCTYPVEPPVDSPIDCNGYYKVMFKDWSFCSCPSCETYSRGTYWINYDDGRMFYIGVPRLNPVGNYGSCPSDYIYEIEMEG